MFGKVQNAIVKAQQITWKPVNALKPYTEFHTNLHRFSQKTTIKVNEH